MSKEKVEVVEVSDEQKLQIAMQRIKELEDKVKKSKSETFRIESTKTANNFHLSFNQVFDVDYILTKYKDLNVLVDKDNKAITDDKNSYVFKNELRQRLLIEITDALKK